jgi:hypothetical protein
MENRNQENVENVIEYGVKEIKSDEGYMAHFGQQYKLEQTIENGVKHTFVQFWVDDTRYILKSV